MPLFKRGLKPDPAAGERAAIAAFWSWWLAEGRGLATGSIAGEVSTTDFVSATARAVRAVHPDLAWETSAGTTSRHALTVTAAGAPELRAPARRLRRAAPAADQLWQFSDVRLPSPGDLATERIQTAGRTFVIGEATVDARVRGLAIDVSVHHPQFAGLDEGQRLVVTFLLLDSVLGEEAVEIWLGEVSASELPALDPVPIGGLRSVVRDLAGDHTGPEGQPHFAVLQGTGPTGSPVLVLARIPLRPATAPQFDTYVGVAVPYVDRTPEGLPGPGSLDALRALEDHVAQRIGGSGQVVAVQSHEGLRILHLYVDGTTPAADQVAAAVRGWDQGPVELESQPDPAWSAVGHLRG
jgi:hypothetical protein